MTKTILEPVLNGEAFVASEKHPFMKGFVVPVLSLPSGVAEYGLALARLPQHIKGRGRAALSVRVYDVPMHYRIRVWPKS